jgi:hypothetical protein
MSAPNRQAQPCLNTNTANSNNALGHPGVIGALKLLPDGKEPTVAYQRLRPNSRVASSRPSSVSGYIRPPISVLSMTVECDWPQ